MFSFSFSLSLFGLSLSLSLYYTFDTNSFESVIYINLRVVKEGLTREQLGEEIGIFESDSNNYVSMVTIHNNNKEEGGGGTTKQDAAGIMA